MSFNKDNMKKIYSSKWILLIILAVVSITVFVIVCTKACTSNTQVTPTFYLSYPRNFGESIATSEKNETCQYILSHGSWESWIQPVIEVTFKKGPSGARTIYQCSAYVMSSNVIASEFKITDQHIEINNQSVDVTLIGHFATNTFQNNEQILSFKVYFLQEPNWPAIFTSSESTLPILN